MKLQFSRYLVIFSLLLLAACENYEFDLPDCNFDTQITETPFAWEVEQEPLVNIEISNQQPKIILQRRMESIGSVSCPSDRDTCLNVLTRHIYEKLVELDMMRPSTMDDLTNSIGVRTPLLSLDSLSAHSDPLVHMGLKIINSCNREFQALGEGVDAENSYNTINDVSVESREEIEVEGEPKELIQTIISGEMNAKFEVDGLIIPVNVTYRLEQYLIQDL